MANGVTSSTVTVLLCLAIAVATMACQTSLSEEEVDRIVERTLEEQDREEFVEDLVEALMSNPKYLDYLEDDQWIEQFTNALLQNPEYLPTPREECAQVILMAAVIAGDYDLPPDSEVDDLCDWYLDQSR
jgi:hypothetical protein